MAKHLKYGGSTAKRTVNCPGWVKLAEKAPARPAGAAADVGTLLHDCLEEHFMKDADLASMVGVKTFNGHTVTEQMLNDILLPSAKQMNGLLDKYEIIEYRCEPFVTLQTDVGGSIDLIGSAGDTVLIADYKTGNEGVSAYKNEQLMFYAMCAAVDKKTFDYFYGCKRVVLAIVQPTVFSEPNIYEAEFSEIKDFENRFRDALCSETVSGGDHCKYCPCAAICPEQKAKAQSAVVMSPKTAQEFSESLLLANKLKDWAAEVEKAALDFAQQGAQIPEFKLVQARTLTRWKSDCEADVSNLLGEKAYKTQLITPAQAVKINPDCGQFTEKPEGKPELVHKSDKRGAILFKEYAALEAVLQKAK